MMNRAFRIQVSFAATLIVLNLFCLKCLFASGSSTTPSISVTPLSAPILKGETKTIGGDLIGFPGMINASTLYLNITRTQESFLDQSATNTLIEQINPGNYSLSATSSPSTIQTQQSFPDPIAIDPSSDTEATTSVTVSESIDNGLMWPPTTINITFHGTIFLSNPDQTTADQFFTRMEGLIPQFTGALTNYINYASLQKRVYLLPTGSPSDGYYSPGPVSKAFINYVKLQYQWLVNADTNIVVVWDEQFTPDDGSPLLHNIKSWTNSSGKTNSPIYLIDPAHYTSANGTYQVGSLNPSIAVDANRDGNIDFGPTDATAQDKPYRFWINNQSMGNGTIGTNASNLENFTRLSLLLDNRTWGSVNNGTVQVALKWKNVYAGTTPSIQIYPCADPSGSMSYLTDSNSAATQISGTNGMPLGSVSGGTPLVLSLNNITNQNTTLLFDATGVGKGQLTIVLLNQNGTQIAEIPTVWMDLRDIKSMYQRAVASDSTTGGAPPYPYNYSSTQPPAVAITSSNDSSVPFVPDPNEDKSNPTEIVFVHGFNMSYEESDSYAQTLFKRFWWLGYKGRFASFRWPTYGSGGWIGAVGTYNDSEYVAWNSGAALAQFVQSIGGNYSVNIIAHSMGNHVVAAALADYGMQISGYAMLHAAVSASCYSQTNSAFPITSSDTTVPDTDGDFFTRSLGYTGQLSGIGVSTHNNMVNYYDDQDQVLISIWDANNDGFKPNGIKGYGYFQNPSVVDPNNIWKVIVSSSSNRRPVVYKTESMAYVDHSLTGAVGANAGLAGSIELQEPEGIFGNDHSYEFTHPLSDINVMSLFQTVSTQFNLRINH